MKTDEAVKTFSIHKERVIAAPIDVVWESVVEELTSMSDDKGKSLGFELELRPGGRWYRDLGGDAGHLWAHVQVVKPPKLLELCGPMMMSYPVASHAQYRLTEEGGKTKLTISHRAVGLLVDEHVEGMNEGWGMMLDEIEKIAMRRMKK